MPKQGNQRFRLALLTGLLSLAGLFILQIDEALWSSASRKLLQHNDDPSFVLEHFLSDDRSIQQASLRQVAHISSKQLFNQSSASPQKAATIPKQSDGHHEHNDTDFPEVIPRAFDPWPANLALPCFAPDGEMTTDRIQVAHDAPVSQGFFFLKTYKTASSTSAGVNLRIARNVARRLSPTNQSFDYCRARFDHGKPWHAHGATLFSNRTIGQSFLWAIFRHPTARAVSQFFHFKVSRQGVAPTDENFVKAMQRDKKHYYVRSLSLQRFAPARNDGFAAANQIIQDYDFIGVSERIDESFVALAMILRIPLSDVLYLSAKLNGGYDGQCTYIQPSFVSPGMQRFFDSQEWKNTIAEDLALYEAANKSLDLTIERLGRVEFETSLATYHHAKQIAQERCEGTAVFPCSKKGLPIKKTSCLWKDSGCGATCLDLVATELGIDKV